MEDIFSQPAAYVFNTPSSAVLGVNLCRPSTTSVYLQRWSTLQNEITEIFNECSQPDWDGNGAAPVSSVAAANAIKLAASLPLNIELPSLYPTSSGKISFQWVSADKSAMMISLDGQERITYAAVMKNGERKNGSKTFWGSLAGDIAESLLRIAI